MNQAEIAAQIVRQARQHADEAMKRLPPHTCPTTKQADAVRQGFQAAYLSGVSQTASFLARGDGMEGVTPQNIMSAATEAGKLLGFIEEPVKKRPGA